MSEHPPETHERDGHESPKDKRAELEAEKASLTERVTHEHDDEAAARIAQITAELEALPQNHDAPKKNKKGEKKEGGEHKEEKHVGPLKRFWGSALATGLRGINLFAGLFKFFHWAGLFKIDYVSGKGGESHGGGGHGGGHGHDDHGGHGGGHGH